MTRELSHKTGAALLRRAFAAKGATLSHTEALDLLAQLKGYQAWSHLQQAGDGAAKPVVPAILGWQAPQSGPEALTLARLLEQHYGAQPLTGYPVEGWHQANTSLSYWDFVAQELVTHNGWSGAHVFQVPPLVGVTLPNGQPAQWALEQNLSDRWGELNYHDSEHKPGLALLATNPALLEHLNKNQWDECTFLCRKDGKLGVLFEVEYLSRESAYPEDTEAHTYHPHAEMVTLLCSRLAQLQSTYPQVQFCVPDKDNICDERPAVWGFYLPDSLTEDQRHALGVVLLNL